MTTMLNTTIFLDEEAPNFKGASCTHINPELFFPETPMQEFFSLEVIRPICNGCPLKVACDEYADRYRLEGIWAGISQSVRKQRWVGLGNNFIPRYQQISERAVELRATGLSKIDISRRIGAPPEMVADALKFAGVQ